MKKIPKDGCVHFLFNNPEGKPDESLTIVFDPARASDATRLHAQLHGWMARIGDAAALERSEAPGNKITEAMRREAVMRLVEHYHSGSTDWSPTGRATKAPAMNPAIAALAQARGMSYEQAQAWIANLATEEIAAGGAGASE